MPPRAQEILTRFGDWILAAALVGLMVAQVVSLDVSGTNAALAVAAALALLVPLGFRTRMPLTLMVVLLGVGAIGQRLPKQILDVEAFGLIVLLVVYNGAAHTSGRRAWAAGAMTAFLEVVVLLSDRDGVTFGGIVFFTLLFGAPWLAGYAVRRRRQSEALMRHERDAAEAAIVDERARIARELHDVVAHSISVIVLQARGGRRLLDTEPEETRGALDTIEHTAQQALAEMRRLVGLLREDSDLTLAPQPTLSQLDNLVQQVRAAGLPVDVRIEGEPVELSPGVDLSAYRIVQEALTNALKHAGPASASVRLRYLSDLLEVDIRDDGAGVSNASASGFGLDGIRERVSVVGGEIVAGPRAEGGFAVLARLPYVVAQ